MGCGGSRLVVQEGEWVLPERIRPLPWRLFHEIKRRENAGLILKEDPTTLSKKELLNKDGGSDDDHSLHSHSPYHVDDHKSASSQADNEKEAPAPDSYEKTMTINMMTAPAADLKMERSVIKKMEMLMPGSPKMASPQETKEKSTEQDKKDEEKERQVNAMALGTTVASAKALTAEVTESGRDEEGRENSLVQDEQNEEDHESLICPGSPSFRVYFIESLGNNTDDDNHKTVIAINAEKGDDAEKRSENYQDSGEIANSSMNSNEFILESPTPNKKKGKKGRRFRRVIAKRKPVPGGVKNLLGVK